MHAFAKQALLFCALSTFSVACFLGDDNEVSLGSQDAGGGSDAEVWADAVGPGTCVGIGGQCLGPTQGACLGTTVSVDEFACGGLVGATCCLGTTDRDGGAAPDGDIIDDGGIFVDADEPGDGGSAPDANAVPSCVDSGGQCVGLVPGACVGGGMFGPDQFDCGGGIGVTCCIPGDGGIDFSDGGFAVDAEADSDGGAVVDATR